jgi:hypothetical protein
MTRQKPTVLRAREGRARRTSRFLASYEECGRVLASRWSGVARASHYRWLDEDPSYRLRFEDAEIRAVQNLKDEAVSERRIVSTAIPA